MLKSLLIANQNGEELKKAIGSDCAEAYNNEFDTTSLDQVDLTKTVTAEIKEQIYCTKELHIKDFGMFDSSRIIVSNELFDIKDKNK